jgi:hypothetical protein
MAKTAILAILAAMAMGATEGPAAAEITVDCSKGIGEIRPLHGGNLGPLAYGETIDLTAYHKDLGIPYTRLHDCNWPAGNVADMHAVFPNPAADPERPESYDFRRTDDYIAAIVKAGSGIVYRLGESIEHTKRKFYVHPPADRERWAAACVGIIRHYNEGWAGGFKHNISYWEIWNEPENRPAMWSGTDDDYFRLYGAAAKAIKARWPELKVGGPAAGYSGEVTGDTLKPAPLVAGLAAYCKREDVPLDFFSWHLYTDDPAAVAARARAVRRWLDSSGFAKTESHLNEWNYLPANDWGPMLSKDGPKRQAWFEAVGGPAGAAFTAAVLLGFQDLPIDVGNHYTTTAGPFGLFNEYGVPRKSFYAVKAFRTLLDTPLRVEAGGGEPGRLAVVAGLSRARTEAGVLISNYRAAGEKFDLAVKGLPWDGPSVYEVLVVDAGHELEKVQDAAPAAGAIRISLDLKAPSVCLVKIRKAGQ